MIPRLRLFRLFFFESFLFVIGNWRAEDGKVRVTAVEQLSRHAECHKIHECAFAAAGITKKGKPPLFIQYRDRRQTLDLAFTSERAFLGFFWTLCPQRRVHSSEIKIAARLFADATGIDPAQRYIAHLFEQPIEIGLAQARRWRGQDRADRDISIDIASHPDTAIANREAIIGYHDT